MISSQELLAAVEIERNMRSRRNVCHTNEDVEANNVGDIAKLGIGLFLSIRFCFILTELEP